MSLRPAYWVEGNPSTTSVGSLKATPLSTVQFHSKHPALKGTALYRLPEKLHSDLRVIAVFETAVFFSVEFAVSCAVVEETPKGINSTKRNKKLIFKKPKNP